MSRTPKAHRGDRREEALAFVASCGITGGTWKELSAATGMHHGSASSALSLLHKAGRLAQLSEDKRDGCRAYVLPELTGSRPTRSPGRGPGKSAKDSHDEGWQIGYDTAMAEVGERPNLDSIREMAYADGFSRGRIQEASATLRLVLEMRRAIKSKHRVYQHSPACWLDHPDCALQGVEKALTKTVPIPTRRDPSRVLAG